MGQFAKLIMLGVTGLSLAGCSQLGAVGNFAWNATESTANFFYKPVASLLRSPPEQAYVFDDSQAYDVVIYEDSEAGGAEVEELSETQNYDIIIYDQPLESASLQLAQTTEARPVEGAGANLSQSMPLPAIPDISFTKIGGGSNMEDWQVCETKAGQYLTWKDGSGYALDPTFESCMRSKNYALESEIALRGL